ncbi:Glycosyltransferase involved in cell wall bisynthesis [Pseudobutyrivibrio ruminis]|uniref:Glycosyltransferase involved in cell wall bisynthesis n=2 Tax=Pseudobutyrivibrio ruminis TaxID=46206 RepID=A0A1H7K7E4_9FIRM|nr:Glycosyltransferase involved in cell wall bisynthesis [Pseudobutyrivibrio ruminis]
MIKVSVIIPFYNEEKELKACLDSVLKQTLIDLEIILVDDGSTDSSVKIIKEAMKEDSRIKLINQNQLGVGSARNKALNYAKGEYVVFLDADDTFYSIGAIEKLYNAAKEKDATVCGGNYVVAGEKTYLYREQEQWVDFYDEQIEFGFWRFIYKKETIFDIKFPTTAMGQDEVFLVRVLSKVRKYYFIPDIIYNYNINPNERKWYSEKRLYGDVKSLLLMYETGEKYGLNKLKEWCKKSLSYNGRVYATEYYCKRNPKILELRNEIKSCMEKDTDGLAKLYDSDCVKINIDINNSLKLANKLRDYLENDERSLLIFGTGVKGRQAYDYLRDIYNTRIAGFVVSRIEESKMLDGKKIFHISEVGKEYIVLIAVNSNTYNDVKNILLSANIDYIDLYVEDFYYLGLSSEMMRYAYG